MLGVGIQSLDHLLVHKTLHNEHGEDPFPIVLVPEHKSLHEEQGVAGLVAAIRQSKGWLDERLTSSGALVFRGFPVTKAEDFAQVVEAFGYKSMGYEGGAATRHHVLGPVFTANELPLHIAIGFHNEMAYLPEYPDVIMFFCEVAPPEGGATGIIPGRLVYDKMARDYPDFIQKLEDKGLIYHNTFLEDEWKATFGTHEKAEASAEKLAKRLEWLPDGGVKVYHGPHPAIKTLSGQHKAWFNSIGSSLGTCPTTDIHQSSPRTFSPMFAEFGDGSPLPPDALKASLQLMDDEQVPVQWKQGDIVVLNNHAVLHARHPSKPPRRILVSMLKKPSK